MVFIVDRELRRTYDPDRGYELRVTSGGSGSSTSFMIDIPNNVLHFSARIDCELILGELEKLGPEF